MTETLPAVTADPRIVADNIALYQREVLKVSRDSVDDDELTRVISNTIAWYAIRDEQGHIKFGPSKFIGYADVSADLYRRRHQELNGRATETRLQTISSPILLGDERYPELMQELARFCAHFGKNPNARARIAIVERNKGDWRNGDREHLNAILALIMRLPVDARRELKRDLGRIL